MKILCVADHIDPVVYSAGIKQRFKDVDLVLSAGDLPLSYYGFIVSSLNKPLLFVFGNHHLKRLGDFRRSASEGGFDFTDRTNDPYYKSFGSTYIGGKVMRVKKHNLLIAGLGGCRRYNKQPNQFTEWQMFFNILRIMPKLYLNRIIRGRYLDVLLTHAPPRGYGDAEDMCHKGFSAFVWFMKRFEPKYLIHGHVHLYSEPLEARYHQYGKTQIINAYDHVMLEIGSGDG